MTAEFDERVVVITGASTGLGRAIAIEVARRGAKAVVANYSRSAAEAEETADLVRAQGAEVILVQADVGDDAACQMIARAAQPYGCIDALFNNAGITKFVQDQGMLDAVTAEDFVSVYRVNVIGAYQMIRAARSLLEAARAPGAVVNTSSVAASTGLGSSVPYAASKGALTTLTLSLARALAPKIRVNAICPGSIDTRWFGRVMSEAAHERLRQGIIEATPLRAASTAEDIAVSAVFLGSPHSRHVTGETLIIDAGLHLGSTPLRTQ